MSDNNNLKNENPEEIKEKEYPDTSLLNLKENLQALASEAAQNKNYIYNQISQQNDEYDDLAYNLSNENELKESSNFIKNTLNSFHKLNSKWCFWYTSRKEKDHKIPYSERMKKFAEFFSLEEFFKYYMYLKSPSDMERNTDLSVFKYGFQPLWESCPDSGIWFIRFKKNDDPLEIDLKWEKILFALIGEHFLDANIIGAVLSIRNRETIIELWFNYQKNEIRKNYIGQKMKEIMGSENSVVLYFKDNENSLKDKSTIKNAETYNIKIDYRKKTHY